MIISELIKELQSKLNEVGDIECFLILKQCNADYDSYVPVDECFIEKNDKNEPMLIVF